ncbi:MAG: hypothetical protein ACRCSB_00700, partial [Bacteroidales bacterium]
MMHRVFFLVILSFFFSFSFGQSITEADEIFSAGNYGLAHKKYKEVLDKGLKGRIRAIEQLAECSRLLRSFSEAYRWYDIALQNPNVSYKLVFNYAVAMRDNGEYRKAKEQMLKYIQLMPSDERAKVFVSNVDQVVLWKKEDSDPSSTVVSPVKGLNSPYSETSIAFKGGKSVVFTSTRDPKYNPLKEVRDVKHSVPKMWRTTLEWAGSEPQLGAVVPFLPIPKVGVKSPVRQGGVAFSTDGSFMVFVQSKIQDKGVSQDLHLYSASKISDQLWGEAESLPFNKVGCSFKDPSLSMDGMTLYFSSNMHGGKGGFDIYASTFDD